MFERFTDRARKVMALANQEAQGTQIGLRRDGAADIYDRRCPAVIVQVQAIARCPRLLSHTWPGGHRREIKEYHVPRIRSCPGRHHEQPARL